MRSTDEQLREIGSRSRKLKVRAELRHAASLEALAACACIALMAVVGISLPTVDPASTGIEATRYGSLILTSPYMGYVVIFVLAFLLGICVALLAMHMRRMRDL